MEPAKTPQNDNALADQTLAAKTNETVALGVSKMEEVPLEAAVVLAKLNQQIELCDRLVQNREYSSAQKEARTLLGWFNLSQLREVTAWEPQELFNSFSEDFT